MEIRAKCKFDFDSVKALMHLTMFKKSDPKKQMVFQTAVFLVLLAADIAAVIISGATLPLIVLLGIGAFFVSGWYVLYFTLPRVRYNALANFKGAENEYVFGDDSLKISTSTKEYNGEAKIEYSMFIKAYETSKYFFLYQTVDQIYIVDKSTLEGGTAEEISEKLKSVLNKKYFVCKY